MGLPTNPEDAGIARLITAVARELGMKTVAEGVETGAQARFLQSIGCEMAQGFLFSRGVPAHDLAALATRSWKSTMQDESSRPPPSKPPVAQSGAIAAACR
jgi:EAL domain-containing protein (putative c-di-GMP-specific phosphodiesterase class I)